MTNGSIYSQVFFIFEGKGGALTGNLSGQNAMKNEEAEEGDLATESTLLAEPGKTDLVFGADVVLEAAGHVLL